MTSHGCVECARRGVSLRRFLPPPGCAKAALVVCAACAHGTVDGAGRQPYAAVCKTDAKKEYRLCDGELDALRCAFTTNPHHPGFADRMLFLQHDLQEAADAKYAPHGGLRAHLKRKRERALEKRDDGSFKEARRRSRKDALAAALKRRHDVDDATRIAALATPRAKRYYVWGHRDMGQVISDVLDLARGAAAAAGPGGAGDNDGVSTGAACYGGGTPQRAEGAAGAAARPTAARAWPAVWPGAKREEMQAQQLRALERRGVVHTAAPRGESQDDAIELN